MKIALLTHGTRGDVQPYVALGKALAVRGHEVLLAAPDDFASWVQGHGLEYKSAGFDMHAFLQSPDARQVMVGNVFAFARIWRRTIVPTIRKTLDATWEAARQAEVIVYHPKVGGAADVAEVTGATLVCAAPFPIFPTEAFPFLALSGNYGPWLNRLSYKILGLSRLLLLQVVNRWRADVLGLRKGPVFSPPGGSENGSELRLCMVSPTVIPHLYERDEGTYATGYWFLDGEREWQPDPALRSFLQAGDPPIYIGFGSVTTGNPARLANTVVEAVRRSNLRAILATGWGGIDEIDAPEGMHVIESAPHDALFKHVSAVVHHGGAGTTAAGLRAGRPTMVCPMNFDQPFWGRRVWSLGCGPKPQSLKRLKADRFANALTELSGTQIYRTRAGEVAQGIANEDGIARAIELIEAAH